jgi:tetratricopeptide (TPR) repeat protein
MEQRRPEEALSEYKRSLELYPRRFNGLVGAARAARAMGNQAVARTFYEQLLDVANGGTRKAVLDEARSYLAGQ